MASTSVDGLIKFHASDRLSSGQVGDGNFVKVNLWAVDGELSGLGVERGERGMMVGDTPV